MAFFIPPTPESEEEGPSVTSDDLSVLAGDPSEEETQKIGQNLMELILGPSLEEGQQQPMTPPNQSLRYGGRQALMPVEQQRQQRMQRQQQNKIPAGQANAMKNFLDQRVQRYSLQNRATRQPKPAPIPMPSMQNRQMRSNMPMMQPRGAQQMPNPMRQQPPMRQQFQAPSQPQMYQPLGRPFQAQQSPMYAFNPYQQYS